MQVLGVADLPIARYDHLGWRLRAGRVDSSHGRLVETHEYFHRQLDDMTAFGGLVATVAALRDGLSDDHWTDLQVRLDAMCDLVHEAYAVGMSLLSTQRPIENIENYPGYDRHVRVVQRLVDGDVHPWVALAALRAAAVCAMQSAALRQTAESGVAVLNPADLPLMERPNHRLAALLRSDFARLVRAEQNDAATRYGAERWWAPTGTVRLSPDSMDGDAAGSFSKLIRRLFEAGQSIVGAAGGAAVGWDEHHDDLRRLLAEARQLAPEGLPRIGALAEAPGGDLLHGGPLDGQVLELLGAPRRAVMLPFEAGELGGLSGEGSQAHAFVVVTTPRRLKAAFDLEGVALPAAESVACMRSTVFEGENRELVLHLLLDAPERLEVPAPVYVSVLSSAAAADPYGTTAWMRWSDPSRLSLIMDTPATAALRRWCQSDGARFVYSVRWIVLGDDDVRLIVGRVSDAERRSPLVVIPSTEFGARWFESACAEDPVLHTAVVEDVELFDRESEHLDIVLTHLLLEERFLGTGSWRR